MPTAAPVTIPDADPIDAIPGADDDHVPPPPSVSGVVADRHILLLPLIADGVVTTVNNLVAVHPEGSV